MAARGAKSSFGRASKLNLQVSFMSDIPPKKDSSSAVISDQKKPRGFFPPRIVRSVSFYIITSCIVASVVVCIMAIWNFANKDSLWRLVASFLVIAAGTALFAMVNGIFGDKGA